VTTTGTVLADTTMMTMIVVDADAIQRSTGVIQGTNGRGASTAIDQRSQTEAVQIRS
jgi:hypothetical protein